jgi:hypothetical protein
VPTIIVTPLSRSCWNFFQPLREHARGVVGEEQPFDGRAPVERVVALADGGQDVVRIAGLGGQAGVLEAIHPVLEANPDLVLAVGMRDHGLAPAVGGVHDGRDLVVGELVLVDELDDVHARVHQTLHLGLRVVGRVDAPAERLLVIEVGLLLDEGAGHEQARAGDLSLLDAPLHVTPSWMGGPS